MKKIRTLSLVAAGALLAFTTTHALALAFLAQGPDKLITFKLITPGGKYVDADNFIAYIGYVENGVCHPKKEFNFKRKYHAAKLKLHQGIYSIPSSTLVGLLGIGYGCVDNVVIYKSKEYQTGFIYLTWDQSKGEYTHARPSYVEIDLSK